MASIFEEILATKAPSDERLAKLKGFTTSHARFGDMYNAASSKLLADTSDALLLSLVSCLEPSPYAFFYSPSAIATQSFSEFNREHRIQVVQSLMDFLFSTDTEKEGPELTETLVALKILARDADGIDFLFSEKVLDRLLELMGTSSGKPPVADSVAIAASMCCVNIIYRREDLIQALRTKGASHGIHRILIRRDITPDFAFGFLRLLFILTRPANGNKEYRPVADRGGVQTMVKLIRKWTDNIPTEQWTPPILNGVKECLQNLFNLTIGMGTLGQNTGEEKMEYPTYVPNFEEVLGVLLRIFNAPLEDFSSNPLLYQVKHSVLNCFVNIPTEFFRILVLIGDKEATKKTLFDILEYEVKRTGDDQMQQHMTLFLVIQQLLNRAADVRKYAFQRLFPDRDLERESEERHATGASIPMDVPDKSSPTVGNRLIKFMGSFNQSLQYVVTELIFQLCGEDADTLIRLTGFGNAAGLLAMRGLYGMGGVKDRDTASEFRQMQKEQGVSPDKIPELRKAPEGHEETEEEKEDRMVENFQRLVDAGIIKLVKKDDVEK